MNGHSKAEMEAAVQAIASMMERSGQAQRKFSPGTAQHSLTKNRIKALQIASALLRKALGEAEAADGYTQAELEGAVAPIASLISKSEKAQGKVAENSWQYRMLRENLRALYLATPLLREASEQEGENGPGRRTGDVRPSNTP